MSEPSGTEPTDVLPYPGQRLGLPASGKGSVAGWGLRVLALFLDWAASSLVALLVVGPGAWGHGVAQWAPMGVFLIEASLFTALLGGSFGQLVVRIAVVRLDRRPLGLLPAALRTFLICLVVPPLVFNRDNRGLQDMLVGTVVVRR